MGPGRVSINFFVEMKKVPPFLGDAKCHWGLIREKKEENRQLSKEWKTGREDNELEEERRINGRVYNANGGNLNLMMI